MRVSEPAADLGVVLALATAVRGKSVGSQVCAFGEVGLSGEVRDVPQRKIRVLEAERLGFLNIISSPEITTVAKALSEIGIL